MSCTVAPDRLGTVLGVWAHPDDEAYLSAGLMALARRAGQRVVVVTATAGEHGTRRPRPLAAGACWRPTGGPRWPPASPRPASSSTTGSATGTAAASSCPTPRPSPPSAPSIEAVRPDTIVTFGPEGMTGHPDHCAVSAWTTAAWREQPTDGPPLVRHPARRRSTQVGSPQRRRRAVRRGSSRRTRPTSRPPPSCAATAGCSTASRPPCAPTPARCSRSSTSSARTRSGRWWAVRGLRRTQHRPDRDGVVIPRAPSPYGAATVGDVAARRPCRRRRATSSCSPRLTGDRNPLHYDAAAAAATPLRRHRRPGRRHHRSAQRRRGRGPPRPRQRVPPHRLELPGTRPARRHDHRRGRGARRARRQADHPAAHDDHQPGRRRRPGRQRSRLDRGAPDPRISQPTVLAPTTEPRSTQPCRHSPPSPTSPSPSGTSK